MFSVGREALPQSTARCIRTSFSNSKRRFAPSPVICVHVCASVRMYSFACMTRRHVYTHQGGVNRFDSKRLVVIRRHIIGLRVVLRVRSCGCARDVARGTCRCAPRRSVGARAVGPGAARGGTANAGRALDSRAPALFGVVAGWVCESRAQTFANDLDSTRTT